MRSKNLKWALIFMAVVVLCVIWLMLITETSSNKKIAKIYVGDKTVKTIDDLYPANTEYTVVRSDGGYNKIGWHDGKIWVEESDCENQTCVNFGKLSVKGLSIICAPHKMVIKIEDADSQADVVN